MSLSQKLSFTQATSAVAYVQFFIGIPCAESDLELDLKKKKISTNKDLNSENKETLNQNPQDWSLVTVPPMTTGTESLSCKIPIQLLTSSNTSTGRQ